MLGIDNDVSGRDRAPAGPYRPTGSGSTVLRIRRSPYGRQRFAQHADRQKLQGFGNFLRRSDHDRKQLSCDREER